MSPEAVQVLLSLAAVIGAMLLARALARSQRPEPSGPGRPPGPAPPPERSGARSHRLAPQPGEAPVAARRERRPRLTRRRARAGIVLAAILGPCRALSPPGEGL